MSLSSFWVTRWRRLVVTRRRNCDLCGTPHFKIARISGCHIIHWVCFVSSRLCLKSLLCSLVAALCCRLSWPVTALFQKVGCSHKVWLMHCVAMFVVGGLCSLAWRAGTRRTQWCAKFDVDHPQHEVVDGNVVLLVCSASWT